MSNAGNAPEQGGYSTTLGAVAQYSIRAVSDDNAVLTFGLKAENDDQARLIASDRLPWPPKEISVELIPPPEVRGVRG